MVMAKLSRQVNPLHWSTLVLVLAIVTFGAGAWSQDVTEAEGSASDEEAAATSAETPAEAAEAVDEQEAGDEEAGEQEAGEQEADDADVEADGEETDGEEADEETVDEVGEEEAGEDEPRFPHDHFGHRLQGGVGVTVGTGYQFEVAYGGDYCYDEEDPEASVCNHRSPLFMDFMLSFGVTEGLEILLEYRLALLEESFGGNDGAAITTSRPMAVGIGVRYFVSPLNRFKFFIGALVDVDFTKNLPVAVTVRPIFGLQIEIVRWVAFFIQGSVNISFVRSFGISLDGGGGFQFRFP